MRDRKSDAHRKAGERKAGRKLGPNEIVHHKNEDKADNSDANLEIEGRGPHATHHNQNRGLSKLRRSLRMSRGTEKKVY